MRHKVAFMIVQIYEIQTPREADTMISLGVDHVGSVLISSEHWQDGAIRSVVRTVQAAGGRSSLIPLFGTAETVFRAVDYYRPDIIHFCEALPPVLNERALNGVLRLQQSVRERFPGLEIMRSIPIGASGFGAAIPSLGYASIFEPWSDWFLTDTLLGSPDCESDQDQPVHGFVGITGKPCDWEIARELVEQSQIPVILAGGIGPDNVGEGISRVAPAGVDSCTLTNAVDGEGRAIRFRKDPQKVKRMVENAKKGSREL